MIEYNLYNLITIHLAQDVSDSVIKSIDFQLNYFKYEQDNRKRFNNKYIINVLPYSAFPANEYKGSIKNYTLSGEWGKYYIDEINKFAIEKLENGFNIWCNSANFLITIFIQLLLIQEKMFFIHSAGVVNNAGEAILFTGSGGVGKTAVISEFVKNKHYKLLGDDIIAIKEDGNCYPFPRSFIIKEYHESTYPELFAKYKKNYFQEKLLSLKEFIRLNAPFREVIRNILIKKGIKDVVTDTWHRQPYVAAVPVEKIFGKETISQCAKVKMIIDLVRYSGREFKLLKTSDADLLLRINSIIQFEWLSSFQPLSYMSIFKMADFRVYLNDCSNVSRNFIMNSENYVIYIPEKASPEELINYLVKFVEG